MTKAKKDFNKQAGCGLLAFIGTSIGMTIAVVAINLGLLAAAVWVVVQVLKYTGVL